MRSIDVVMNYVDYIMMLIYQLIYLSLYNFNSLLISKKSIQYERFGDCGDS